MLKGTLDDFTLADVFRLLSLAKRTGKLDVERSAGHGRVFFRDGEIYYADSSLTKEPLGKKLIRAQVVTETQLMDGARSGRAPARAAWGRSSSRPGSPPPSSSRARSGNRSRTRSSRCSAGTGAASRGSPSVEADVEVPIAVSVENLIMESSRRLEELELIQRKIPGEDTIPGMAPSPPEGAVEINITPEEWRILVLIDGRRTVRDISAGRGGTSSRRCEPCTGSCPRDSSSVLGPPGETPVDRAEAVPGFEAVPRNGGPRDSRPREQPAAEPQSVEPPVEDASISSEPADESEPTAPELVPTAQSLEASSQISEFPSFDETASQEQEPPDGSETRSARPMPLEPVAAAEPQAARARVGAPRADGRAVPQRSPASGPRSRQPSSRSPETSSSRRATGERRRRGESEPSRLTSEETLQLEIDKAADGAGAFRTLPGRSPRLPPADPRRVGGEDAARSRRRRPPSGSASRTTSR